MDSEIKLLNNKAKEYSEKIENVFSEMKKVIVGQHDVVEKLVLALLCKGHVLLEGVPGLAKTLMVKTLSDSTRTSFCRIQFTPDMLPADITGTKIYNNNTGKFTTQKGPIFANFILADEINRAPPKVQSALLEAMQERQVTIQGDTFDIKEPFIVLATQNPVETEGTYRLPEAQIDRFVFKLMVGYPKKDDEQEIISRYTKGINPKAGKVISASEILEMQKFCTSVYADETIEEYVAEIVDATRHPKEYGLDIDGMIEYGASPRASIWLILAAKANAMINGRGYVIPEDIVEVAQDVLRHRVILTYEAEAEGKKSEQIIETILSAIKSP